MVIISKTVARFQQSIIYVNQKKLIKKISPFIFISLFVVNFAGDVRFVAVITPSEFCNVDHLQKSFTLFFIFENHMASYFFY